ncbi:flavodoxin [Deinococcus sp. UYEF24]
MTHPLSPNIGLYYGSSGGSTEEMARKLAALLHRLSGLPVTVNNIADHDASALLEHDILLLGCSTWYVGDLQDDWESRFTAFQTLDLSGKRVALFGTGDQYGYPDTFQDALGILGEAARRQGAILTGWWPTTGYDFEEASSRGVEDGRFFGLALDEDNQYKQTEARLNAWAAQLMQEWGLAQAAAQE